jgi:hypothetical protein
VPLRKDKESDFTELTLLKEIRDATCSQAKCCAEQTQYLKDIRTELQILNQATRNLVLTSEAILAILELNFGPTTDFTLSQLQGDSFMAINGVAVGATGTFQIGFVPPNGVPLPTPPTVTVDDTNVTLSPVSTDGQFTFTAAVAATDTGASFNLTIAGTNAAGTALSHVFNVPIIQAPPPQITDFSLNQLS